MRFPLYSCSTLVYKLILITQVLDGRIDTVNVAEEVRFESDSFISGDESNNQLLAALLVIGEEGEFIDALGLAWDLPDSIHDTPERSEVWGEWCVEIMRFIVVKSKPRRAIRDATIAMESLLLMGGEAELLDALRGRG